MPKHHRVRVEIWTTYASDLSERDVKRAVERKVNESVIKGLLVPDFEASLISSHIEVSNTEEEE